MCTFVLIISCTPTAVMVVSGAIHAHYSDGLVPNPNPNHNPTLSVTPLTPSNPNPQNHVHLRLHHEYTHL